MQPLPHGSDIRHSAPANVVFFRCFPRNQNQVVPAACSFGIQSEETNGSASGAILLVSMQASFSQKNQGLDGCSGGFDSLVDHKAAALSSEISSSQFSTEEVTPSNASSLFSTAFRFFVFAKGTENKRNQGTKERQERERHHLGRAWTASSGLLDREASMRTTWNNQLISHLLITKNQCKYANHFPLGSLCKSITSLAS